jgi:hypothetical protein
MSNPVISSVSETLKSNFDFEFSVDFQGQVEYIESDDTDQFLEYELVLLFLIDKDLVPVNERTEGRVFVLSGIIYIDFRTCSQVGEDWDDDTWEKGSYEISVSDLMGM